VDSRIGELVDTIRRLEVELEVELAKRRTELAFTARGRVVQFEERILRRHRQLKTSLARYLLGARPLLFLTAPVIYAPLVVQFGPRWQPYWRNSHRNDTVATESMAVTSICPRKCL
jgi:hypothetical protein